MAGLGVYHAYGEELERGLRLKTFPLAIKLLKTAAAIPKEARRPLRDFGHHLSLCQVFQLSRREGLCMAMLLEDMWCFEPAVGYGLTAPPAEFLGGLNRYPGDVRSLEAGKAYARELPRVPRGACVGVLSAPLRTTPFEPDVVMTYCDSAQLSLLLLAREWKEGHNLPCALSSHAACIYAVVPAIRGGRCQVAVPCRGDHYHAMAGDDEMIFTVPRADLADLIAGLRYVRATGSRLPRGYTIRPEYGLPRSYERIGKLIGRSGPAGRRDGGARDGSAQAHAAAGTDRRRAGTGGGRGAGAAGRGDRAGRRRQRAAAGGAAGRRRTSLRRVRVPRQRRPGQRRRS